MWLAANDSIIAKSCTLRGEEADAAQRMLDL
jgi:hypothetical protein